MPNSGIPENSASLEQASHLQCVLLTDSFQLSISFNFISDGRTRPTGRDRHSPPLPSRSGYKGRPVCRCHHRDLPGLSVQWPVGQIRCCHDRGDYTEGPSAAGESPHQPVRRTVNRAVDFQHNPLSSTPPRLAGSRTRSWPPIGQG